MMRRILLLLLSALLLPTAAAAEARYTLFAGGDTMIGRWVHHAVEAYGVDRPFEAIRPLIEGADVAMTNLENVVATTGHFWDKGENRPYLYRARPEMLDIVTTPGFDVMVASNNHGMDYGPEAALEQLELLEAAGLASVGTGPNLEEAGRPTFVKVGDLILAFIGLEPHFPLLAATKDRAGNFHAEGNEAILEAMKAPIAEARASADLVVFTPHWGANWTENPTRQRIELAHALMDMGVDVILGHSSHHLHGIELYKGKLIVYDMGSLFFDTVGQGRLRYSAGFLLHFGRSGFRRLEIHPLRLLPAKTVPAKGPDLDKVHELMIKLTAELDPDLEFKREGDLLTLDFKPRTPPPRRTGEPEKVHVTGTTRRLPDEYLKRRPDVVLDAPPDWASGFEPVPLIHGATVIGAQTSECVRRGRAFEVKVALKTTQPIPGNWHGLVLGKKRGGKDSFHWWHPFADGAWLPHRWGPGQVVVDHTLVRPSKVSYGTYDLYWGMAKRRGRERIKPLKAIPGVPEPGLVPIGSIEVLERGIPKGPAGVSWDGKLPPKIKRELARQRKQQEKQMQRKGPPLPTPPVPLETDEGGGLAVGLAVPGSFFVAFLIFGIIRRGGRKG